MRSGFILFVGILALAMAPTMGCAQYSGAFGLSGLPSMPSFCGGSGKCGEAAGCAGIGAPAVYFGWGIPQNRNTNVSLTAQNRGVAGVTNVDINVPTGGFWLGGALPIGLTKCLSFIGTGWYLFPGYAKAINYEDYNAPTLTTGSSSPALADPGYISNRWGTKYEWWYADGALAYTFGGSCCDCGCFSLLLGLRYDYYTASICGPDNLGTYYPTSLFNSSDAGDVISRCWIPFVGLQTAYTDCVQSLAVRIIGIPTNAGSSNVGLTINPGPARFEYNNVTYNGGDFLEVFAEYTRKFFGASQAGVFARWNNARATSSGTGQALHTTYHDTFDYRLNRSTWTLGGLVTLNFNTPFCN